MAGEQNQIRWVGVRPTDPPENIPVNIAAANADVPIKSPAFQSVIQIEPGPWDTVRSGVTRTQIIVGDLSGTANKVLHTVTAGKTLHIVSLWAIVNHTANVVARFRITTGGGTEVSILFAIGSIANIYKNASCTFPMPIKVQAGYKLDFFGGTAGSYSGFSGWEE